LFGARGKAGSKNLEESAGGTQDSLQTPPDSQGLQSYVLDNSILRSSAEGIGYRKSKNMEDKTPDDTAKWGHIVEGWDEGDGWVKVKSTASDRNYLPVSVRGSKVLFVNTPKQVHSRFKLFSRKSEKTTTPTSQPLPASPDAKVAPKKGIFGSLGRATAHPNLSQTRSTSPPQQAPQQNVEGPAGNVEQRRATSPQSQPRPTRPMQEGPTWTTNHPNVGRKIYLPADNGPIRAVVTHSSSTPPWVYQVLQDGDPIPKELKQADIDPLFLAADVVGPWKPNDDDVQDGWKTTGHLFIGRRVLRVFHGQSVFGTVVALNDSAGFGLDFRVVHDDGDEEDLTLDEVQDACRKLQQAHIPKT
jgi:hypothetical protein